MPKSFSLLSQNIKESCLLQKFSARVDKWRRCDFVFVDKAFFENTVKHLSILHKCVHSVALAIHLKLWNILFDLFVVVDAKHRRQVLVRAKSVAQ